MNARFSQKSAAMCVAIGNVLLPPIENAILRMQGAFSCSKSSFSIFRKAWVK